MIARPDRRTGKILIVGLKLMSVTAALVACSTVPNAEPIESAIKPVATENIYFVTTRQASTDGQLFSDAHANDPAYGVIRVGIPRTHQPGELNLASGEPDPTRHLHTRAVSVIPSLTAFVDQSTRDQPGAMIFVHGYNTSFIESIYRFAQIAHDTDLPAAAIQFSWASAGEPSAYIADRDRALLSRYALSDLVKAMAAKVPERLVLVGHSMGSLALMEALALLDEADQRRVRQSVSEIVLVAPDLDTDLFAAQLARTSIPPDRFAIAINQNDRALSMSSFLAGGNERLGNKSEASVLAALGVRILDVTGVRDGDGSGHFLPATSPTLLEVFRTRTPQ